MRPRHAITVRPGQWVRVCFNARRTDEVDGPLIVPARLSGPIQVRAVCSNAVRVGEQWVKRFVKVRP